MHPEVTYTPCATSSKGGIGNTITFAQFEEGGLLSKSHDNVESGDESVDNSIIPPLIGEEEMDVMDLGNESDYEPMPTDMLEDICDGIKYHPSVNRIEACYEIRDCIKRGKSEWIGSLSYTKHG